MDIFLVAAGFMLFSILGRNWIFWCIIGLVFCINSYGTLFFDGGPSKDSQDEQNWPLDRAHHGLTVVGGTQPWQALGGNRVKPGFVYSIC